METKARLHPINSSIESFNTSSRPKVIIDKNTLKEYCGGFEYGNDETDIQQGFKLVYYPPLPFVEKTFELTPMMIETGRTDNTYKEYTKMYSEIKYNPETEEFYCELIDIPLPPPMPEPQINIDCRLIKTKIGELFAPRGFDFQNNYPMIMDNLKDAPIPMYRKNMENLKTYSLGYKLTGLITDAEFTAFRQIFIDNGFDLNDY